MTPASTADEPTGDDGSSVEEAAAFASDVCEATPPLGGTNEAAGCPAGGPSGTNDDETNDDER